MREAPVWSDALVKMRGRGPLAVFLPYQGRVESSQVRIYDVATALRPLGWRTLILPRTLTLYQRRRFLAAVQPDIVVMQGMRHPLNRPEYYPEVPVVMDMDDADFHLPQLEAHLYRSVPELAGVIAGSRYVADWCRGVGCKEVHVVWTGMEESRRPRLPHYRRPPVIAWAQTRPMSYVYEAQMVRDVSAVLAQHRPDIRLRLYDWRPGDDCLFADWFRQAGVTVEWKRSAKFSDYIKSFDDVSIGFAPLSGASPFSRGKSFGKVLAYLDRHVPVICSNGGEHSQFFLPSTGVVSNDPAVWAEATLGLLADARARQDLADRAFAAFQKKLSLNVAARKIDKILRHTIIRHIR